MIAERVNIACYKTEHAPKREKGPLSYRRAGPWTSPTHNRRRLGETVSRGLQVDRHVHCAGIELRGCRDVLVGARDVVGDGLAEAVAVEVDVDAVSSSTPR